MGIRFRCSVDETGWHTAWGGLAAHQDSSQEALGFRHNYWRHNQGGGRGLRHNQSGGGALRHSQGREDSLWASWMPPEKTTEYMASTPTVEETIGSRPTAAQPLNRALDAMLVRKSTRKYIKNLQRHTA